MSTPSNGDFGHSRSSQTGRSLSLAQQGSLPIAGQEMRRHLIRSGFVTRSEVASLATRPPGANGFVNAYDTTLSFVDGTRTVTLTATADVTYYVNDVAFTLASGASVTVVIDNNEGLHFVYFNDDNELVSSQTWVNEIITRYTFVSSIYWDATTGVGVIVSDERHGAEMDSATHLYNHNTYGARYSSGLGLGDIVADGGGSLATHAQFSVANGAFYDEDIRHDIIDLAPQTLSVPAEIPLLYRSGVLGEWRKLAATSYPVTTTGTGRAAYNSGGTWALTEVSNNKFVLMHYLATADIRHPIMGLVGIAEYNSKSEAQAAAQQELLSIIQSTVLANLTLEWVALGTVIFQTNSSYTNAVKSQIVSTDDGDDYVDWRDVRVGSGSSSGGPISISDISDIAATRLLGNSQATVGPIEEIEVDSPLLLQSGHLSLKSAGVTDTYLDADSVTTSKIVDDGVTAAKVEPSLRNYTAYQIADQPAVTNSTLLTNLIGYAVPANALGTTGAAIARVQGYILNNTTATVAVNVAISWGGSFVFYDTWAIPKSTIYRGFELECRVQNCGATNKQWVSMKGILSANTNALLGQGDLDSADVGGLVLGTNSGGFLTANTTSAQTIAIVMSWAAAAVNRTFKCQWGEVEIRRGS